MLEKCSKLNSEGRNRINRADEMPYMPLPEVVEHASNTQPWYLDPAHNVLARYRGNNQSFSRLVLHSFGALKTPVGLINKSKVGLSMPN